MSSFETTLNLRSEHWGCDSDEEVEFVQNLTKRHGPLVASIPGTSEEASHAMRQQLTLFEFKSEKWEVQRSTASKEKKLWALVNSISNYNYTNTFFNFRKDRHASTGEWLFAREDFKQWAQRNTPGTIFWCHGIPGAGKSVLTTAVIDELLSGRSIPKNSGTFIGYYFFDYSRPESLKFSTLLQCLVKQILTVFIHKLPPNVEELLPTFCPGNPQYAGEDFKRWFEFLELVASIPEQLYFCIDGIDECEVGEQCRITKYLKMLLEPSAAKSNKKLYLSSRPEIPISRLLDQGSSANTHTKLSLHTQGLERPEILSYIRESMHERLEMGTFVKGYESMLDEIENALMLGAKGMFLWVSFQLDEICSTNNVLQLRKVLASLPGTLDETYSRILRRISKDPSRNSEVATQVFEWIAGAKRPLTLDEMTEAISIMPDDKDWQDVVQRYPIDQHKVIENCANLITLNDDDTIQFAHSTVLDFLCSAKHIPEDCESFKIDLDALEAKLAHICITYLTFPGFEQSVTRQTPKVIKCTPLSGRDIGSQIPMLLGTSPSAFERRIGNTVAQYARIRASTSSSRRPSGADLKRTLLTTTEEVGPSRTTESMLNYIAENWWRHCWKVEALEQAVGEHWISKFNELCFRRKLLVQHLPWLDPAYPLTQQAVDKYEVPFTWAVTEKHEALLHFLMSKLHMLLEPPHGTPIPWTSPNLRRVSKFGDIKIYIIIESDLLYSLPIELYNVIWAKNDCAYQFLDPLLVATCRGYTNLCRTLLEDSRVELVDTDTSYCPKHINEFLRAACELGRTEFVNWLLQWALRVGSRQSIHVVYLLMAMEPDRQRTLSYPELEFRTQPEDLNCTPIDLAFINGHLEIIKIVLNMIEPQMKPNVPQTTKLLAPAPTISSTFPSRALSLERFSSLTIADSDRLLSTLDLTKKIADPDSPRLKIIDLSAALDLTKTISRIYASYKNRIPIPSPLNTLIHELSTHIELKPEVSFDSQYQDEFRFLGSNAFQWNAHQWKAAALLCASITGRTDIVTRILTTNASELYIEDRVGSNQHNTESGTESMGERYPAARMYFTPGLFVVGVDLGVLPLLVAFCKGWAEVVKLLLAAGGLNLRVAADECLKMLRDVWGTPLLKYMLHFAAEVGHIEMVKVLLLGLGGSFMNRAIRDKTPLYYACHKRNLDVVQLLLAEGASAELLDSCEDDCGEDMAPLYHACHRGDKELVKLLLAGGGHDVRDSMGCTAKSKLEAAIRVLEDGSPNRTKEGTWVELYDKGCSAHSSDAQLLEAYKGILALLANTPPAAPPVSSANS